MKTSTAGATPKLTKSARLSSSAPNLDCAFSARASRPSTPSSRAAMTTSAIAMLVALSIAMRMAVSAGAQAEQREEIRHQHAHGNLAVPEQQRAARRRRSSSSSLGSSGIHLRPPIASLASLADLLRRAPRARARPTSDRPGPSRRRRRAGRPRPAARARAADTYRRASRSGSGRSARRRRRSRPRAECHDAAGDQARDLHHARSRCPPGMVDDQRAALVLLAGLVERGIEKDARARRCERAMRPGHRRAVDVHVEHRQEDRDAHALRSRRGRVRPAGAHARWRDLAVGRRNHQPSRSGVTRAGSRKK